MSVYSSECGPVEPFLTNVWYMAGWSHELGESLLRRRICGRAVLLFRKESGEATALDDRCPHRFAPLSAGTRIGDTIRCGYHGLGFDAAGACVHNPFSDTIPKSAKVTTYPLVERDGIVWIWMGDRDHADPNEISDFSMLERPCGSPLSGYTLMRAGYEFGTDNLMDLSHIEFVHKGSFAGAGVIFAGRHELIEDGETLHSNWWMPGVRAPAHTFGIYDPEMITDHWLEMRWNAPASMYLQIGATPAGAARKDGLIAHQAHILTPETADTTHYFWASTRPSDTIIHEADAMVMSLFQQAFDHEDKPIIEAAYANLEGEDFWSNKPVYLGIDAGGTRARRTIEKMKQRERDRRGMSAPAATR
jgi:phenylpropionate dioxygenase-like ring-hydroxylating dioxygenase large terminal subunit